MVDVFFSLADEKIIAFKSVVFDTSQIDYKKHFGGDKELGFYTFMIFTAKIWEICGI
ncbi:MAG: hypothetical protein ABFS56_27720 [Pseudomonadota bacterium]